MNQDIAILTFLEKNKEKEQPLYTLENSTLCHYTNLDGLFGILNKEKKCKFWFTRFDYLNDALEGKYVLQVFKEVCEELFEKKPEYRPFINQIADLSLPNEQYFIYPLCDEKENITSALGSSTYTAYICSFSLKHDSLDMWRYYSKGQQGICLEFSDSPFDKLGKYEINSFSEDSLFHNIHCFKVIYEKREQKSKIEEMINDSYSFYNENMDIDVIKRMLSNALKEKQFIYKHECFASENEYRFIDFIPKKQFENCKYELPPVCFRNQNGLLVPYLETMADGEGTLNRVVLSPFYNDANAIFTFEEYIKKCGFENASVLKSTLPAR